MRRFLPDLMLLAGLGFMTYGVRQIYVPASWIFLGVMLFLMGVGPSLLRAVRKPAGRG